MQVYKVLEIEDRNEQYLRILDILELPWGSDVNEIFKFIFEPRFKGSDSKNKVFDYLQDFDLVYANFKKYYNIDLIDDELEWTKFLFIFEDLILSENSLIKRISFRGKLPKANKNNKEQRQYLINMKNKYRLEESNNNVQQVLGGMFNLLKARVGGKNGK